ncbi:putative transcription factor interactor and regulator CCHC(Zn) family [Helianthus debilis subsp. tardiflorus]
MMLRNNRKEYKKLRFGEFIKHWEAQETEQRKIARMKNCDGEQDFGLYFKSGVSKKTNFSPKVETAYNAKGSSESTSQGSSSTTGFSSFPTYDPQFSTTKSGKVLQCNIALKLENDQNYTKEVAKSHMSLLVTVLESYGDLVAGRIGNLMLTKEDYDQIDAEEMELVDIKWCMASVLRRAEKFKQITGRDDFREAHVSTLGFDKSKVTCFCCREKGHFKRECINCQASVAQNPFGNNDYHKKAIYHQVTPQPYQQQQASHQAQTAHGRNVIEDSKRASLVNQGKDGGFSWDKYIPTDSKVCLADQDDEKLAESFSWDNFCPDQEFMAKEMSKEMSNVQAFVANAYDEYWAAKYRKIREKEEEKLRKIEEEEEEEDEEEEERKKEKKS